MALSSIKAMEIQRFIRERQVMASTQRKILVTFRSLYSFAKHCGFTGPSPPHLLRCPRRNQTIHERILSKQDIERIIGAAVTTRDAMLIRFLHNSGARIGEVAKLRVKDLRFHAGFAEVTLHGKGDKMRHVLLNVRFSRILKEFVKNRNGNSNVFHGQRGALTASGLKQLVKRLVNKAGVNQHISSHFFRHHFATISLNNGAKLQHVAYALGHRSLQTTSIYVTHRTRDIHECPSSFLDPGVPGAPSNPLCPS